MKAAETIRRYRMLENTPAVLAAVSGGADSMALMHFLCALREKTGLRVCAAHVNHGLRGAEARRDEDFVRRVCLRWGVELFVKEADVRLEAEKSGLSVEEAGRRVRYAFFRATAERLRAKIATAHTLSDCMETVLLNFARGTGLAGLCGIPPIRGNIIRPLIETTRSEVEAYCTQNEIPYVTDSTNLSDDFTRNRIRHGVVPELYRLNPAFDRAVLRALQALSADERLLKEMAREALKCARVGPGAYDAGALSALDGAVLSRALKLAAEEYGAQTLEAVHLTGLMEIVAAGGGRRQLRGGCYARVSGKVLSFHGAAEEAAEMPFRFPLAEGDYRAGRIFLSVACLEADVTENFKNIARRCFINAVDCDKIIGKAEIRPRMAGDSYRPAGRGVGKSLKKLFNEASVPVEARCRIPVACDEAGILWVSGFGPDERCHITESTKRIWLFKEKSCEEKTNDNTGGFTFAG